VPGGSGGGIPGNEGWTGLASGASSAGRGLAMQNHATSLAQSPRLVSRASVEGACTWPHG
jgi:hypothetical protein